MQAADFKLRRQQFLKNLGKGHIAVLPSQVEMIRNGDAHYRYRQNSDFYYLTGFNEPESVAVFIPGRQGGEYILFVRPRDASVEQWTGPRAGLDGAREKFAADEAFAIGDLDAEMPGLLQNCKQVHYPIVGDGAFDERLRSWIQTLQGLRRSGVNAPEEFVNINHLIHEMRLFKSDSEIEIMRHVGQISATAHQIAMAVAQPGMKEYELSALIEYECKRSGCEAQAYETIVGGGANACVLHYIANRDTLNEGDLVLIDAGGEYEYYAADITRTFPVSGQFTEPQRLLYELVLRAQIAAIEAIRPGVTWNKPQEIITRILSEGLLGMGLLQGSLEDIIALKKYQRFYMHNFGHWLGLDVHDVGNYKVDDQWRSLQPGMVLTVEPGLYISQADDIPSQWWNIGIRIEDDVLVTKDGCEVLSAGAPKTVVEIEAQCRARL